MEKIGKYDITGEIGRGAMGIVYKGEDPVIGRPVAIKTIRFDTLTQASEQVNAQRRFMREARSAGNLSHPNIVTIYDVGEDEGLTYIVMEFIEGQSLEELITAGQRFSVDEIIAIMAQIGDALDFAHSKGIVHRDIKPGNILMDRAGRPHIVDFGIARISSSTMTQTSMVMGTPFYMSPEQIAGKKVDNRADIFSLGAVLYEMLTLQKAFPGDNITTVIYKIVNEHPVPARNFQQDLPDGLDHILHTALAKDLSQRYSTCAEFSQDLQNYPAYAGIVPDKPPSVATPIPAHEKARKTVHRTDVPSVADPVFAGQKERNRKPLLYMLGAMMIVVIFVVFAVVIFSNKDKTPVVSGGGGPPVPQKIIPKKKPQEEPSAQPYSEATLSNQVIESLLSELPSFPEVEEKEIQKKHKIESEPTPDEST
ncbi:MAG: serine/threonine protein kinase, partial [Candidatus Aminicenantes bacterium]|nr:serine/threonine protein kinase [Candidatus Aminicenantes bacterium]